MLKPYNAAAAVEGRMRHKIRYFINDVDVCRQFFIKCLGRDHRVVDEISSLVVGREIHPQIAPLQHPAYQHTLPKIMVCKAFWQDFFTDCQRPNNHTRLFPVNQSYQVIYSCKFIPWWLVTHGGVEEKPFQDVALGCDINLTAVTHDDEDVKQEDEEEKKEDEDDFEECWITDPFKEMVNDAKKLTKVEMKAHNVEDDEDEDASAKLGEYISESQPFGIEVPEGCPSFVTTKNIC
jgi:hypothetical protein